MSLGHEVESCSWSGVFSLMSQRRFVDAGSDPGDDDAAEIVLKLSVLGVATWANRRRCGQRGPVSAPGECAANALRKFMFYFPPPASDGAYNSDQ